MKPMLLLVNFVTTKVINNTASMSDTEIIGTRDSMTTNLYEELPDTIASSITTKNNNNGKA